jgi:hypothetical protein
MFDGNGLGAAGRTRKSIVWVAIDLECDFFGHRLRWVLVNLVGLRIHESEIHHRAEIEVCISPPGTAFARVS